MRSYYVGQKVVITNRECPLFGKVGIIEQIQYELSIDEDIPIEIKLAIPDIQAEIIVTDVRGIRPYIENMDAILPTGAFSISKKNHADEVRAYIDSDVKLTNDILKYFNEKEKTIMKPTRIFQNNNATIVFWDDRTKTVVKKMDGQKDDIYDAFCAAFAKKMFGSNSKIKKMVDSVYETPKKEEPSKTPEDISRIKEHINAIFGVNGGKGPFYLNHMNLMCSEEALYKVIKELSSEAYCCRACMIHGDKYWEVVKDEKKEIDMKVNELISSFDRPFMPPLVIEVTNEFTDGDSKKLSKVVDAMRKKGFVCVSPIKSTDPYRIHNKFLTCNCK